MSGSPPQPDKRRRLTAANGDTGPGDLPAPSRPPLKKRFTSTSSGNVAAMHMSSATTTAPSTTTATASLANPITTALPPPAAVTTTSVIETTAMAVDSPRATNAEAEELERASKDVILKRMRLAKDNVNALEDRAETLDSKRNEADSKRSALRIHWTLMQHQLHIAAKVMSGSQFSFTYDLPPEDIKSDAVRELESTEAAMLAAGTRLLDVVQEWQVGAKRLQSEYDQKQDMAEKKAIVTDWVRREINDLKSAYESSQRVIGELQQHIATLTDNTTRATDDVRAAHEKLEEAQDALDQCIENLRQTERRYDRENSAVVAALTESGVAGPKPDHERTSTPASGGQAGRAGEAAANEDSMADQAAKLQLVEHQLIMDARLKELDELKRERESLKENYDQLRQTIATLSDERLEESEYFKTLQISLDHYKSRAHHLEDWKEQLEHTLDDLTAERSRLEDEIKAEKANRTHVMEAAMRKIDGDILRIEKGRGELEATLDGFRAKEARGKQTQDAVSASLEEEKAKAAVLQEQLKALREETRPGQSVTDPDHIKEITDLQKKINDTQTKIKYLGECQTPLSAESLEAPRKALEARIQTIQQQLNHWTDAKQSDKNIRVIMEELDHRTAELDKMQLMIDFYEKFESLLHTQIDHAADMYGKLEEQQSSKVFDPSYKHKHEAHIQGEMNKYTNTFASLIAVREKEAANVAAYRRTSEQQLEHIRQLEERSKSLEEQVEEKEAKMWQTSRSIENLRFSVEDLQYQCSELRVNLEHSETYIAELRNMAKDKSKLLDEEKHLRRKVEEEYDGMKRKWDMLSQGENPAEDELKKECEDLRALLKCSACKNNFRRRLLARCMHTFCEECIDACLSSRQRRCPTCGASFSQSEVRHFFL